METEQHNSSTQEMCKNWERQRQRGKIFGGILVMTAGILLLARQSGVLIPQWVFSWEMFLVVLGLFIGVKHGFRRPGWLILTVMGLLFMMDDIIPDFIIKPYLWPVALIVVGIFIIFKPRRSWHHRKWKKWDRMNHDRCYEGYEETSTEDKLELVTIFGAVKKNIISKDFKGGEMVTVFGGAEVNLSQADINGRVTLEVVQVFGGTRLIVPAHWEIQSEIMAALGSVEDKRPVHKDTIGTDSKILILKGSTTFGGIEITSY